MISSKCALQYSVTAKPVLSSSQQGTGVPKDVLSRLERGIAHG